MKLSIISLLLMSYVSLLHSQNQPNIIYILADDMGSGDVMVYNKDAKFPTPHIDKMASEGVTFTDAHTSSSVCTPTRYGIMTGRYSWRTSLKSGVTHGLTDHLIDIKRTTVASYLKTKGYATAMVGKWHLGMDWTYTGAGKVDKIGTNLDLKAPIINGPNAVGFDYYFGISASLNMDPHAYIENTQLLGDKLKLINSEKEVKKILGSGGKAGWLDLDFKREEVMQTFTDNAIEWMKKTQTNSKKPFFLYFPLNAPHSPIVPSNKFKGKSGLSPHGDFCMEVDNVVGQIILAVEEMGLTENTLIIFTADNGVSPQAKLEPMEKQGHFSSYIYRGVKGTLYEGGHRVPFVVKWPKNIKKSFESDYLTCTTDLLATVADIFGDELPDNVGEDSMSFLPVLLGKKKEDSDRGAIVHHSDAGVFSIRKDTWKLIFHDGAGSRRKDPKDKPVKNPGQIQLFDMELDVEESKNVANENPQVVTELKMLMASYINKGRSTKGKRQNNDPSPKGWKHLALFQEFLKIDN
jgi:arylsulfatase A